MNGPNRRGFAIPVVVLVLLAATAFGHVILYSARQELAVAVAERDLLTARLAAEGGIRQAGVTLGRSMTTTPVGDSLSVSGTLGTRGNYRIVSRRLSREIYLLEGEGRVADTARWRVGRLLWALDPGARVRAFAGAVESGGSVTVSGSARITGSRVSLPPFGWGGAECAAHGALIDSISPAGTVASSAAWIPSATGSDPARAIRMPFPPWPPPPLSLGLLNFDDLSNLADAAFGIAGGVSHVHMGHGCPASATGRWGTPMDPAARCGAHFPIVAVQGSLRVTGGEGQGILLVNGDVEFAADATFAGIVLASGNLELSDDADLAGWLRSGGGVRLTDRAKIEASACAGLRALDRPALRSVHAVPAGSWISPV